MGTVSQEFNLNTRHFLTCYGVLRSIPGSWKEALKSRNVKENMVVEDSQCGIEANGQFIPINSVTANILCKSCISQKISPPTSKNLNIRGLLKVIKVVFV